MTRPGWCLLLVAPFLGEALSTSSGPLRLLNPLNLALFVALYGCGALLCREVARRWRFGWLGLGLLGAAYGIYEEALVDGYWFDHGYWHDTGIDGYSRVWHTNLLLAAHLTTFHVVVSVCASIVVVERLFPTRREERWAGRVGLVVAALALVGLVPFLYGDAYRGPLGPILAAVVLLVACVAVAFGAPRTGRSGGAWPHPRRAGWVAAGCAATHFVLVYTVRSTGLPWPLGVLAAMAPVALGVALLARAGPRDPMPVVTGILAFFVVLDVLIGLLGGYDLIAGGLVGGGVLWRLNRRTTA